MYGYLGIDVGSVSTNLVMMGEDGTVKHSIYLRTRGKPIEAVQTGLKMMKIALPSKIKVAGVGTTGSGRHLAGVITGADIVKNEITTHAIAASNVVPGVQTILEIGGQDSKIIVLRNGVVADFAMNTVCAAGTGSFLDQQASRLNIDIEEFGPLALQAKVPVRIAGRCAVFAESDMIHKQQMGYNVEDILAGLCEALVRNYLNNVGKGKEILAPVVFQGGVAANSGMKWAFEKSLETEVIIPPYFNVMGALGAALLAREATSRKNTDFYGFEVADKDFKAGGFACDGCPNVCEVVEITESEKVIARWGDRCGRWSNVLEQSEKIS
ncbi:CoA-substrate-specific enzyme activase, putative [Desulfotomaculum arcticum]|uniref:CoA-substrate-specific enzyme activase, putative n=1 Tax=Desulfotruncus arcticus DSM 17038 TaxID=1121424 RepID=A0A1I2MZ82_9FIRM|nr:acyl-CoA dehydratase activase [Desulfotruncus arcticus]SFF94421.1 CoA-substrate-specific enzyme activase, putative [Desulfotomaculum arcticum] [Desulfotruncus arcticus DSM 17038]